MIVKEISPSFAPIGFGPIPLFPVIDPYPLFPLISNIDFGPINLELPINFDGDNK